MELDEISAILEIQRLMGKYERFYDKRVLDPLVDLFTEDCTVDYDVFGSLEGRAAVKAFLEEYFAGETQVTESFHVLANPWIEVDTETDRAIGRWHFLGAYTLRDAGACWLIAFYDIEFVRGDDDQWRIDDLDWEAKYVTPYGDGWEREPMVL